MLHLLLNEPIRPITPCYMSNISSFNIYEQTRNGERVRKRVMRNEIMKNKLCTTENMF